MLGFIASIIVLGFAVVALGGVLCACAVMLGALLDARDIRF